jgi:hypothetical protein
MGRNPVIILDTGALLWLAGDPSALSPQERARINDEPLVGVSAISAFEIGLKWLARKLSCAERYPCRPALWTRPVGLPGPSDSVQRLSSWSTSTARMITAPLAMSW